MLFYVCDKPASECTSWYLGEKGVVPQDGNGGPPQDAKQSSSKTDDDEENASLQQYKNHCNATGSDKRGTKNLWDKMRAAVKDGRDPSAVTDNNAAARSTAASASAALAQQPRLCDTFVASDTFSFSTLPSKQQCRLRRVSRRARWAMAAEQSRQRQQRERSTNSR